VQYALGVKKDPDILVVTFASNSSVKNY